LEERSNLRKKRNLNKFLKRKPKCMKSQRKRARLLLKSQLNIKRRQRRELEKKKGKILRQRSGKLIDLVGTTCMENIRELEKHCKRKIPTWKDICTQTFLITQELPFRSLKKIYSKEVLMRMKYHSLFLQKLDLMKLKSHYSVLRTITGAHAACQLNK
jgi:hypothetical protein